MRSQRLFQALAAGALLLLLAACAAQPPVSHQLDISRQQLLDGSLFAAAPASGVRRADISDVRTEAVDMLAVNDDMRAFLRAHVPDDASDRRKVELILAAILGDGLNLNYNNFKTFTAMEAFYTREGNCMSFTNLFVALAREAGVDARFQEVETPPVWAEQGETWLYNLHINALVNFTGFEQIVDFNLESYNNTFHRQVLDDEEALARYHNNMGVHWMTEQDYLAAFQHFRQAIELRDSTGYFWTNLATLYRRAGDPQAAEKAYLVAVDIDQEPIALSNLSRLYARRGDEETAAYYRNRVQLFRRKNPYYLFHLAEQAYAQNDYDTAAQLLRTAIRRNKHDHEFYRLMGLTHLKLGNVSAAQRDFSKAAVLAQGEERERYNHKVEMLAGG